MAMSQISKHGVSQEMTRVRRSRRARLGALLLLLGSAVCVGIEPASADLPPKPQAAKQDPQVKQLVIQATQAMRQGNYSLATIQLKNALRIDPNNGGIRALLGTVILQTGDVL